MRSNLSRIFVIASLISPMLMAGCGVVAKHTIKQIDRAVSAGDSTIDNALKAAKEGASQTGHAGADSAAPPIVDLRAGGFQFTGSEITFAEVETKVVAYDDVRLETHSTYFRGQDSGPWTRLEDETITVRECTGSHGLRPPKYVKNPRILAMVPGDSTAFEHVFGARPSGPQLREMNRAKMLFEGLDQATSITDSGFGEGDLLEHIRANDGSNTVVVVGHSEGEERSARYIRLPNGDSVSVNLLHREALEVNKQCLVLTCFGDDFSIRNEISILDAYKILRAGFDHYSDMSVFEGSVTTDDFVRVIRAHRQRLRAGRITMIAAGGTAVAGSGAYLIVSDHNQG